MRRRRSHDPPDEEESLCRQLQEALDADPDNSSNHFNLGAFLWRRGEDSEAEDESRRLKGRAAEHFLATAKLNPNDGAAFRLLGHYYGKVSLDPQRASKCYQRAVSLNPEDSEAGEGLCDLFDGEGKESLEVAVCKQACEKSPRAFWAFKRLGYLQVHRRTWSEAVQSLQQAIRGYPQSADLWEALGLAYHRLGMFTAAIKSYGRANELDKTRIFALLDSGDIQLMLGCFRKGVEQFRCALELAPCNLSAHFGLASGLLGWSKECTNSGAFNWGADLLKEAEEVAKASTTLSGSMYSAWKLLGDIQIALAKCLPWEDKRKDVQIDEELLRTSIDHWKMTCLLAAKSAKDSYQKALHMAPWRANIYTDIAISLDLIGLLEEERKPDQDVWQLTERMSLGGLTLEGANKEFWLILGNLSSNHALKQHALIRSLQLDGSLSLAWACLGKLYRDLREKQLARHAFDHARSIDPSLALPWAGMSADYQEGSSSEAYESCLRAVQTLPASEFQIGLGALAMLSGNLLSPQVFGAIRQAVQQAPCSPEVHNLNGLICEARGDYPAAAAAFRMARCVLNIISKSREDQRPLKTHVSMNLARSLCKAGHTNEAAQECEDLKKEGLLDNKGLQIYAFALWKLGYFDLALNIARELARNVSKMTQTCATAALGLICTLIYGISGKDSLIASLQKFPNELLRNTRMIFIISSLNALYPSNQLQLLLQKIPMSYTSSVATEMHSIAALRKMIHHESQLTRGIDDGVDYLKKVLHMYPDSSLIRNQLSSLLLSSRDRMASQKAVRCLNVPTGHPVKKGLRGPYEVHGAAVVSCYTCCTSRPKFSFSCCRNHTSHELRGIKYFQRWLHQEPWNQEARYLLILNILQKAYEEKFPQDMHNLLKRLILDALSKEENLSESNLSRYQNYVLLLSASEISLRCDDFVGSIDHIMHALELVSSDNDALVAHLQLCRIYAAKGDFEKLKNEYLNCLQFETEHPICLVLLKYIESKCKIQNKPSQIDVNFQKCLIGKANYSCHWASIFYLVCAQAYLWDEDYINAEQALAQACSLEDVDSCLLLCHGAICMELVRQQQGPVYLSGAVNSLTRAQQSSRTPLPIVSLLLAQAEASLGAKPKWESNLRTEWFAWPAEMRPAEMYFQMHLLARQSDASSSQSFGIETTQSPERWILRAIHLNPSCARYWKVLQKLIG